MAVGAVAAAAAAAAAVVVVAAAAVVAAVVDCEYDCDGVDAGKDVDIVDPEVMPG